MDKILHYVSIMNRAGEETFIMNVFRTIDLSKFMFDFLVCSNEEGDYDAEIKQLGGKIIHINYDNTKKPLKRIRNAFLLYNLLKRNSKDYTTFHIHTQHAMDALLDSLAAKIAGFNKVIVHSHSTQTLFHRRAHLLCRPVLNYLPIYRFACSDMAGKWLFGKNGKYEIINNGIITSMYMFNPIIRNRVRKNEGWDSYTVIGHVGSFTYPKNHSFILDVFCKYLQYNPKALLVLVGKGELLGKVKTKAENLGINSKIVFLGGRNDVNELYSAFDALLFPSHYEGLPVTLVEAQAAGLPCLISDSITDEINISPSISRMSLEYTDEKWALQLKKILTTNKRLDNRINIIKSGFDISATTSRLCGVYQSNLSS